MRKLPVTALSVSAALLAAVATTAMTPQVQAADDVKCYGIAKAGENDCANQAAGHSCAGHSTMDYNGLDFKAVSKDKCMEMGGQMEPFEGMNENVKS